MSTTTILHHHETWPIAVSNVYGTEHTEEALQEAFDTWVGLMDRGKHVLIADLTRGHVGATAPQRKRMAGWIAQNEARLKSGRQLAHVLVVDNALVRGVITAVFWIKPPANPHYTARDMDDAVDYALGCLQRAGVAIDPSLVRAARRLGSAREKPATKLTPKP